LTLNVGQSRKGLYLTAVSRFRLYVWMATKAPGTQAPDVTKPRNAGLEIGWRGAWRKHQAVPESTLA
jgi:hypothetical protein